MKRKVALLTAPRKFEIVEEEIPALAPDQVLIKVAATGLCHSDMPTYLGDSAMGMDKNGHLAMVSDLKYPQRVGHEPVGEVIRIGSQVKNVKVGDYVGGPISGTGSFASHVVVGSAKCIQIPKTVKSLKHCLAEPIACVANMLQIANPELGDYVAVVGCGMMGLLTLAGLAHSGAREIIAIDMQDSRLEIAKELGATRLINPGKQNVEDTVFEMTEGHGADVVIEITGSLKGLDTAASIVRTAGMLDSTGRGKILIPSLYGRKEEWNPRTGYNLMFRAPVLHSTHPWYCVDYYATANAGVDAYIRGVLPLDRLITHEFPLSKINEAFQTMESGADGYIKGIVVPD